MVAPSVGTRSAVSQYCRVNRGQVAQKRLAHRRKGPTQPYIHSINQVIGTPLITIKKEDEK